MEEKEINPAESLEIISSMINAAKNKLADDGFFYVLWGWIVFICAVSSYISVSMNVEYGFYAWAILTPLGAIASIIYGRLMGKKERVRTYVDTHLEYSWGAFGIGLVLTLIFGPYNGMQSSYFFLMILYGVATFISGGLLRFKPLLVGSFFSFAFACLCLFVGVKEQFLCLAAAVLFSYIIPGHMLKSKYKSQTNV
jgi:hypothetical protein